MDRKGEPSRKRWRKIIAFNGDEGQRFWLRNWGEMRRVGSWWYLVRRVPILSDICHLTFVISHLGSVRLSFMSRTLPGNEEPQKNTKCQSTNDNLK